MIQTLAGYNRINQGLSYWQVRLNTGKILSELQIDWTSLANNGDTACIQEVILCTPVGNAHISIEHPYSTIQLKQGMQSLFTGEWKWGAQIVGRIEGDGGICTCMIWDAIEKRLYTDHVTSVRDFKGWRPGIADIGLLALDPMGARL